MSHPAFKYGEERFTLTEDHLKLIREMHIYWDFGAYEGAPAVDIKRPYGNSDVAHDVAEIIGEVFTNAHKTVTGQDYDEYMDENYDRLIALHKETADALQICVSTGKFEPGVYRMAKYHRTVWEKVS